MEKQVVEFNIETAVINALDEKYGDIQILPDDKTSYDFVMGGLRGYRALRRKIDDRHKELKKDALEYTRKVDAEKNRLRGLIDPGEEKLKAVRKAEDDRIAAIDKARVDAIQQKIRKIESLDMGLAKLTAPELQERIDLLEHTEITRDEYEEFTGDAGCSVHNTLIHIRKALENRVQLDEEIIQQQIEKERLAKEQEAQRVESERLEKIRLEQEAKNQEIEKEKQEIQREKDRLEAEKKAEQERKDREEFKLKAEEEAKAKAEREAKEKAEREAKEAIDRKQKEAEEQARQEALKPDKEKLIGYIMSLQEIPEPQLNDETMKDIMAGLQNNLYTLFEEFKKEMEGS